MPETRAATEADIIQADEERVAQAYWLALCDSKPAPDDFSDITSVRRWTKQVNRRFAVNLARLQ
jgi:hypothetical protein